MKKTLFAITAGLFVLGASAPQAQAQGTINYSVQALTTSAVANADGSAPIAVGSAISIGYYPTALTSGLTGASSWDDLLLTGTANQFVPLFAATMGYDPGDGTTYGGVFAGGEQQYVSSEGKTLVMIFSNDSVLTDGTEAGIFSNPTWVIPALAEPVPSLIAADIIDSDFTIFGATGIGAPVFPDPSGATQNYNTAAIPEPSTYALLALGGVALGGFVLRRRVRA